MTQSSRPNTPAPATTSSETDPLGSAADSAEPAAFDYDSEAELFATPSRRGKALGYRRFARAADAVRFAIEELPSGMLLGTHLQVDDRRVVGDEIRRLYDSADYPLVRSRRAQ